jgi:hypothetical protein
VWTACEHHIRICRQYNVAYGQHVGQSQYLGVCRQYVGKIFELSNPRRRSDIVPMKGEVVSPPRPRRYERS